MPRKGPAPKRPLVADPVYQSPLVTQLVNKVLVDGKRSVAEAIVYGALEGARAKSDTDPVVTLKRALDNVKPASRSAAAASVVRPTGPRRGPRLPQHHARPALAHPVQRAAARRR